MKADYLRNKSTFWCKVYSRRIKICLAFASEGPKLWGPSLMAFVLQNGCLHCALLCCRSSLLNNAHQNLSAYFPGHFPYPKISKVFHIHKLKFKVCVKQRFYDQTRTQTPTQPYGLWNPECTSLYSFFL